MTLPKPKSAESRRRIDSQKPSKFSKNGFDLDVPTLIISGVVLFVVFFFLQDPSENQMDLGSLPDYIPCAFHQH